MVALDTRLTGFEVDGNFILPTVFSFKPFCFKKLIIKSSAFAGYEVSAFSDCWLVGNGIEGCHPLKTV